MSCLYLLSGSLATGDESGAPELHSVQERTGGGGPARERYGRLGRDGWRLDATQQRLEGCSDGESASRNGVIRLERLSNGVSPKVIASESGIDVYKAYFLICSHSKHPNYRMANLLDSGSN